MLVFLDFVISLVLILLFIFFMSQFLIPLLSGKPMFPRWRKAGRHVLLAKQELSEIELEEDALRLEAEARLRRAELEELRKHSSGGTPVEPDSRPK